MSKIRTGFKVCRKTYRFISAFKFGKVVEYEINKWTYQPKECGPLSVLRTLSDVKDFIKHNRSLVGESETFLCEYEESHEHMLYDDKGHEFKDVPHGTDFATKVKLIKKIDKL